MGSFCQVNLGALDALGSVGNIGCATSPIQVSQDFPLRWPTITFGITKTDSSEAEKAKEVKRIGPVPLACTASATEKVSNC
jgi:hypothetical protein